MKERQIDMTLKTTVEIGVKGYIYHSEILWSIEIESGGFSAGQQCLIY